ncbi:unnamed protein product [Darwinula stevensoni]|uniref:Transmembrane protein 45B n=1 Tax=Darwinula stevensoni TaxID=69355 RepID=A0A7R9A5S1_9CRUS|nr:unnamed protein product [Darwinula stevensoni]CAG0892603.1 unnamed protein product [Darwinula stevensoni]
MGSLGGHLLPGGFFFVFALWWTWNILVKWHRSRKSPSLPFVSSTHFPLYWRGRRIALEPWLKIILIVIAISAEIITGFDEEWRFAHLGNAQHVTMFSFFLFNAFVELLVEFGQPLPPNLDYATAVLAFIGEGVLFSSHLHGRSPMDVQVHTLLALDIWACALVGLLEMIARRSALAALTRAYFVLIQGTWFCQVGFILYPPVGEKWNLDDHGQMMIVAILYAWHHILVAVGIIILNSFVAYRFRIGAKALRHYDKVRSFSILSKRTDQNGNPGGSEAECMSSLLNTDFSSEELSLEKISHA